MAYNRQVLELNPPQSPFFKGGKGQYRSLYPVILSAAKNLVPKQILRCAQDDKSVLNERYWGKGGFWIVLLQLVCLCLFINIASAESLQPSWTFNLKTPLRSKGYKVETVTPTVFADKLIVGSLSGELIALDRTNGALLWKADTGAPIEGEALVTDSHVVIGNNEGLLVAYETHTGNKLWEISNADEILGRPVMYGDDVLVVTSRDRLLRVGRSTGERKEALSLATFSPDISLRGQGNILAYGALFIVPLSEGSVIAYDPQTRSVRWRQGFRAQSERLLDSDVTPILIAGNRAVFVATYSQGIYALDPLSGDILWRKEVSSFSDAFSENGIIYLSTTSGELYALNAADGSKLWRAKFSEKPSVLTNPVLINGRVIVADRSQGLYIVDSQTGESMGKVAIPGGVSGRLTSENQNVYFVSNAHRVYAFKID